MPISAQERHREPGADTDPLSAELLPSWCRRPSARAEPHHAQRHAQRLRVPLASALPGAFLAARSLLDRQGQAGARFLYRERDAHRNPEHGRQRPLAAAPSVTHSRRPQPFPALHRAGTHTGGGLELMQGTKSERSLHNCVCRPMEEHFPGAHLRGVATRSTCIITRRWASAAYCPCSSPVTHHRHEIAAPAATRRAPSPVS